MDSPALRREFRARGCSRGTAERERARESERERVTERERLTKRDIEREREREKESVRERESTRLGLQRVAIRRTEVIQLPHLRSVRIVHLPNQININLKLTIDSTNS